MSLLSSEVHVVLVQLLQKLSSPDNQARTEAEDHLNNEWFVKQPDVLLMGLVEQMQLSQESSVRNMQRTAYLEHAPLIGLSLHADAVFCSNPISQNVNQDKKSSRRGQ